MLAADDGKTIGKEGPWQFVDTMTNCDKTAEEIFGDASELTFDGLLRKWRAAGFTLEEKKGDEKGRFQFLGRVIPSKGSAAPSCRGAVSRPRERRLREAVGWRGSDGAVAGGGASGGPPCVSSACVCLPGYLDCAHTRAGRRASGGGGYRCSSQRDPGIVR